MNVSISYNVENEASLDGTMVKIPLFANNFYKLYNQRTPIEPLVDDDLDTTPALESGIIVPLKTLYYQFNDMADVVITRLRLYDGAGTLSPENAVKIYAVDKFWQRQLLVTFTGPLFNQWQVVDFDPVEVKYLYFEVPAIWGMNELEVWGTYTPVAPKPINTNIPTFSQLCGTNVYQWDFVVGGQPASETRTIAEYKMDLIEGFGVVRHYSDWRFTEPTEGRPTFQPQHGGSWWIDLIYETCKARGIEVINCVQGVPSWIYGTYPTSPSNNDREVSPLKYGLRKDDPNSYIEQAKIGFQMAARYGNNPNINLLGDLDDVEDLPDSDNEIYDAYRVATGTATVDSNTFTVYGDCYVWYGESWERTVYTYSAQRWTNDEPNEVKIGLDTLNYIECGNENDRWWKTRNEYQTAREHAANLSAFYDGHKGTMGHGVGVKNACPNMKVLTCGTISDKTDYFQGIVDWCKQHRGYREDGSVDLPFDLINFHTYRDDAGSSQGSGRTRGRCPEATGFYESLLVMQNFAKDYFSEIEILLGEIGYDENQSSTQKAIPIGSKTVEEVKADWILRTVLEIRNTIKWLTFYELFDNDKTGNSTTMYQTSGLANYGDTNPSNYTRRMALSYIVQCRSFMGNFTHDEIIEYSESLRVDKWINGSNSIYAIWSPTEDGSEDTYILTPEEHASATLYTLNGNNSEPISTSLNLDDSYTISYSETPVFVLINN